MLARIVHEALLVAAWAPAVAAPLAALAAVALAEDGPAAMAVAVIVAVAAIVVVPQARLIWAYRVPQQRVACQYSSLLSGPSFAYRRWTLRLTQPPHGACSFSLA